MGAERPDGAGTAPDARLELTHGPDGVGVLADGRALTVPPHASAIEVGLAAARRHAARAGRDLRVEVVDAGSVTTVTVGRHGLVTLVEPPARPTRRPAAPPGPGPATGPVPVRAPRPPEAASPPPVSAWARPAAPPARPRPPRPVASLVTAALVATAVVVGAVGTGVATLSSSQALPDSCRPVTVYAVGGEGGASDVLRAVTDPLSAQFGEKVSVVTVPPPPAGGSYASAESEAVGSLASAVGDHVGGCPTGSLMLFGYSRGAQVAGDLASRVGTGLEPRIPANLVRAVGLFGDPARSPRTRAVPDGTTGQGALPPRAVGFGSLDARTIEICAPGDPVCDSPPNAASPPLDQALASPVHGSYQQLPVAAGTTAPQWAATSLGKVVAAVPTTSVPPVTTTPGAGTPPQAGPVLTTTPGAGAGSTTSGPASTDTGEAGAGATGSVTTTPPNAGSDGSGTSGSYGPDGGAYGPGAGSYGGATSDPGVGSTGPATTVPPVASGSSAAGGTGDGAGASTRRSGAASATTTPDEGGADPSGPASQRSSGTDPSRTTARSPSGTVSSGHGSDATSGTSSPASTRARPRSTSEEPTTTSTTPSRGHGTDADAAWSLVEGLTGFKSTPWNNQNATDPSTAPSPNVPGRQAVKFEMPGGGKRTEAEPDVPEFRDGEKAFVGYSGFFGQGFPTDTDTWQLIMQFKQPGTGSPPLAVEVGKGQLRLANDGSEEKDFCPVTDGPFSFQLGITFGGAVDAWCNGTQTLTGYTTPRPNVQGSAYLKTGIYRDESIAQDSTLFLNDLKVGTTVDSVSGLAGTSGGGKTTGANASTAGGTSSTAPATGSRSAGDGRPRPDDPAAEDRGPRRADRRPDPVAGATGYVPSPGST